MNYCLLHVKLTILSFVGEDEELLVVILAIYYPRIKVDTHSLDSIRLLCGSAYEVIPECVILLLTRM